MSPEVGMAISFRGLRPRPGAPAAPPGGRCPFHSSPRPLSFWACSLSRRPNAFSKSPDRRRALWPGHLRLGVGAAVARNPTPQPPAGTTPKNPRFIRTVHGFGYAFCGEVRESAGRQARADRGACGGGAAGHRVGVSGGERRSTGRSSDRPGRGSASPWRIAVIAAAVVVLLGAGSFAIRWTKSSYGPTSVVAPRIVPLTSLPGAELHPGAVARRDAGGLHLGRSQPGQLTTST